jgi:hypothetical protein
MEKVVETVHPDYMTLSYAGRILDKSGYREYWDEWVKNKESWQGHWHETNVRVLTPEAAVFTGLYSIDLIEYSDQPARHYPQNAMTTLVEKTPDGWKWTMGANTASGFEEVEGS